MDSLDELKENKIKKIANFYKQGINPYPSQTTRTHSCLDVLNEFSKLNRTKKKISLVGRIRAIREHGGSCFLHINDGSAQFQVYLKKDILGDKKYFFFLENFDIGDFIEVKGDLFITKKGEKTLKALNYKILTKSFLPIPSDWYGLEEVEERFRKRYLDLILNPEIKNKFIKRSEIVKKIRKFLDENNFIEVETPMLQTMAGGARAKPFKTHLNALNIDLYLRIAPELYLKRLLVGGLEKVYELNRNFRNEGMDREHNPEFTMLEFYAAYWDYQKMMNFVEKLLKSLAPKMFKGKIKRLDYNQVVGKKDEKEVFSKIKEPTFVINYPIEISPLAKKIKNDETRTERFQLIVNGLEIANGFSELNDPIDQKQRFEAQEALRKKGDGEAHQLDYNFIEALEHGMPPAAGIGIGIDRLTMLLTDSKTVREVILFPLMKPK